MADGNNVDLDSSSYAEEEEDDDEDDMEVGDEDEDIVVGDEDVGNSSMTSTSACSSPAAGASGGSKPKPSGPQQKQGPGGSNPLDALFKMTNKTFEGEFKTQWTIYEQNHCLKRHELHVFHGSKVQM